MLELLIVIAIIGILASIVMVSFSGTGEKARIAQGMQFADTMRASLQADMVAWWTFDETFGSIAYDNWFDQYDGIVYGAEWVEGVVNNALEFNGDGDYVGGSDSGLPAGNSDRSVFMWVKPNLFKSSYQAFFFYGTVSGGGGILFSTNGSESDKLIIGKYGANSLASTNSLTLGAWQHIGFTISSGDQVTFYINGVDGGTSTLIGINTALNSYKIGDGWNSGDNFNGLMDEVQIYNRALTFSEINQLYVQGLQKYENLVRK